MKKNTIRFKIKDKKGIVAPRELTWREKYLIDFYCEVKEGDENYFQIVRRVKPLLYIIAFIPVHVLKIFWLMWDGGLKNFCFETRNIDFTTYFKNNKKYIKNEVIKNLMTELWGE